MAAQGLAAQYLKAAEAGEASRSALAKARQEAEGARQEAERRATEVAVKAAELRAAQEARERVEGELKTLRAREESEKASSTDALREQVRVA